MSATWSKRCRSCGETKGREGFGSHAGVADGVNPDCRECANARSRASRRRERLSRLCGFRSALFAEDASEAILGVYAEHYSGMRSFADDLRLTLAECGPAERMDALVALAACRAAAQAVVRRYDWCEGGGGI